MILKNIDRRLSLFGDYLTYRIDAKFTQMGYTYTPQYIMEAFKKHGFLINVSEIGVPLLTFDQWLALYKHDELVLNMETIVIGTNPMMQVVKYGGRTMSYDILGSHDLFEQWDSMLKQYLN